MTQNTATAGTATAIYVINRQAGSGRAGRAWDAIAANAEPDARVLSADTPDAIRALLDIAWRDDIRRVIAVGGDGTFHHLVNYVMTRGLGSTIELGLIPAGTGSDLARSLRLPQQPATALDRIRTGRVRAIDLLAVDLGNDVTRYAANVASFGISAAVAADVRSRTRRNRFSYFSAAVRQLLRGRPVELILARDGERWADGHFWLVVAANGSCFGGGMRVAPDALPDDGALDCIIIRGTSTTRLLWQLPKVYSGRHLSSRDVATARMVQLDIERVDQASWQAELDGETYNAGRISVRTVPGAIRVLA
jgi:diacylglycerol kinase (ATP)